MQPYYNENLIQPYQTVLVSFKNEKYFYAKLDPKKYVKIHGQEIKCIDFFQQPDAQWYKIQDQHALPIKDLGELDYNMTIDNNAEQSNESEQNDQEMNMAEQFTSKIAFSDKNIQEKLQNSDVFNVRNQFAKHKQAAKVRQKYGNLVKIEIITPYLLTQVRFREILTKTERFHFLSGASLSYCAQYLNLVSGKTRILVFDDYDGIASAMVASRLQLPQFSVTLKKNELLKQINDLKATYQQVKEQILPIIKCLSLKPCTSEELQFSHKQLWELQRELMVKVVIPALNLFNIKSPYETFILETGQCHSAQLKTAFVDANLLPINGEHFEWQMNNYYGKNGVSKQLQIPPCIATHPGIFFEKDIELADYCYLGEKDPEYLMKPQFNIYDVINIDYQMWFERKMQTFGFSEFQEVSRVFQLHETGNLWNLGVRRNFYSYLHKAFIDSAVKNEEISLSMEKQFNNEAKNGEFVGNNLFNNDAFTFNSAFFAIKSNAVTLFRYLLQFIESGAPCVVFSQYQQVLLDLSDFLIANKLALRVGCGEVYEVGQQVLPQRTHPSMISQVNGGYVLKCYVQHQGAASAGHHDSSKRNPQPRRGSKLKK